VTTLAFRSSLDPNLSGLFHPGQRLLSMDLPGLDTFIGPDIMRAGMSAMQNDLSFAPLQSNTPVERRLTTRMDN
jgi:hypothetical protein